MSPHKILLSTLLCCGLVSMALLIAATGRLEGTVSDRKGNKQKDVRVSAFPHGNQKTPMPVSTDKNGLYQFRELETGSYKLTFRKKGFRKATRDVEVTPHPPPTLANIELEPAGTGSATGQVVDPNGTPVKTAQVQALSVDSGDTLKADLNGLGGFNFRDIPEGTYQLTASAPGYLNAAAGVEVEANKTATVTLILTPSPAPIARNVVDASPRRPGIAESAEPLPNARLQFESGLNWGTFDLLDPNPVLSLGVRYAMDVHRWPELQAKLENYSRWRPAHSSQPGTNAFSDLLWSGRCTVKTLLA